jgi:ketosteroid isomerase-like protein
VNSGEDPALIRRFLDACVRAEPEEFAGYLAEDVTWWHSPWQPVKGREAIRETLRRGALGVKALRWEIRRLVAER